METGGDIDHVNAKIPFDAMEAGDATAKAVVDNWIEYVACGISNVVNTFEPEAICIGGGVSNQGETLLAPIRKYVEEETKNITTGKMPAIRACVLTNDAGVIGAAAWQILSEPFVRFAYERAISFSFAGRKPACQP